MRFAFEKIAGLKALFILGVDVAPDANGTFAIAKDDTKNKLPLLGHWRMDATHFKDLRLAVLVPSSGSSTDAFEGVDMARAN